MYVSMRVFLFSSFCFPFAIHSINSLSSQRLLPYSLDLRRSMCFMYVSEYMLLVRSSYLQAKKDSGTNTFCSLRRCSCGSRFGIVCLQTNNYCLGFWVDGIKRILVVLFVSL